jgi:threonine/homoserine/homoserine lactone efflux protein
MLFSLFLKGILIGLLIAAPVGPVGVLCVRRTVFQGPLVGLISGLGAAIADALFGVIAGFGLTVISDWLLAQQVWLRAAGGVFLLAIGLRALLRGPPEPKQEQGTERALRAFASSFGLTITNPVTILAFAALFAWAGFHGAEAMGQYSPLLVAGILVAGVFVGSLSWWLALAGLAAFFRRGFREVHFLWLNRISGGLLAASGLGLLLTMQPIRHFIGIG